MSYETADILDGAADIIEKRGWIQNDFENAEGVCATEACYQAGGAGNITPWLIAFERVAGEMPVAFNDTPGRTKQEVLDALRLAAKQERILADGIGGDAA